MDRLRAGLYDVDRASLLDLLGSVFSPDALIQLAHPFETLDGPAGLHDVALAPLLVAVPDLERRDWIVISGTDPGGDEWVGCAGHYTGHFAHSWLGIPPTGRQVAMRFHEFFRIEQTTAGKRIVEMQALWDVPEVMMQSGVWPMGPSLGRDWLTPTPATQDGIADGSAAASESAANIDLVVAMLTDMGRHPAEPVEAMRLEKYWHPKVSWYGPAGIGTARGIAGFRKHHQIPFLAALPDRRGGYQGEGHFFGEGAYVGVTGWPGMQATITGAGWLGIAPSAQPITMRSLDFWRIEKGLIRENWVLVDLLHVWNQVGVDVLARMRELVDC